MNERALVGMALLTFAIAGWAYTVLPEEIATHWNVEGVADGFGEKLWGIILFPLISAAMYGIYKIIPIIEPLKKNVESFHAAFAMFMFSMQLFFVYVFALLIAYNLGNSFNFGKWMLLGMAFLVYQIGVLLPQTKRNHFIGFRTPWTLSDDAVWKETHEKTGNAFRVMSLLPIVGFVSEYPSLWWMAGAIVVPVVYGVVVSFLLFRKKKKTT